MDTYEAWDRRFVRVIASSALVLGALAGGRLQLPKRVLAGMLAFAAGALITALTFEMFEDSYEKGGIWRAALGLAVGAVVFTVVSQRRHWMAKVTARTITAARSSTSTPPRATRPPPRHLSPAPPPALLAAATWDGVPENLVLGVGLAKVAAALRFWPPSSSPISPSAGG